MTLANLPAAQPSQVEHARDLFQQAVDDMLPSRDDVLGKYDELVDTFNDSFNWFQRNLFSRGAHSAMRDAIDRIGEHLQTVVVDGIGTITDVAGHVFQHHVPILSLFSTSIDWIEQTMTPLSEVYGRVPVGPDNRDFHRVEWDSSAGDAYSGIVGGQQGATDAAKDLAKVMSRWLSEIADENVSYVTFLLNQLATIVGKLADAVAAVGTSAGVFTLDAIAELIGDLVSGAIQTLAEITDRTAGAITRIIDAEADIADHSHFPNGQWPIAVTRP